MATITIDDKKYDIDQIKPEGKDMLGMLQATERKIAELNRDLAISQTARNTYLKGLMEHLPQPIEG